MRQLTAFASYFDNFGALLNGRARFYNSDGTPAVVYAWDNSVQEFVENGSIVFTNSSGQLEPQVFLDNHDYLIVFDKYIGDGRMTEDDDSESWEEQGSAIDKYNTIGIELSAGAIRAVSTIADLRQTLGLDTYEVIELMGYYESGDKPIIYYKWNPYISTPDNGGSIIKVANVAAGRWELVSCPEYLDVRHFGAFPMQGIEENAAQRYEINNAYLYAHSQGCGVYFWADATHAYYDISGLVLYDVNCDSKARVFSVDENNVSTITKIKRIYCAGGEGAAGTIRLVDEVVRSSWQGESSNVILVPSHKLIVDSPILYPGQPVSFTGISVEMLVNSYCVLDSCDITSNGVISGNITIRNCELKTSWFSDNYDFDGDLVSIDNKILLSNCKDAQTYILLKNKQEEANYGDLGEGTISDIELLAGCVVDNAVFDNVTLEGDSELHNVSGTVEVYSTAGSYPNCLWFDCFLNLTSNAFVENFRLSRGKIEGGNLSVKGELVLSDSVVDSSVSHVPTSATVSEQILRNTFSKSLAIVPQADNSVVNARWVGNHSSAVDPLQLGRAKLYPADSAHTYVYKDNTGTFLPGPEDVSKDYTLTITDDDYSLVTYDGNVKVAYNSNMNVETVGFFVKNNAGNDRGIPGIALFRVGTDDFTARVDWICTGPRVSGTDFDWGFITYPLTFRMVMKNTGTNAYRACVPNPGAPVDPSNPTSYSLVIALANTTGTYSSGAINGKFRFSQA